MSFSPKERDDLAAKLEGVYEFYGKDFDASKHLGFWLDAVRNYRCSDVLDALARVIAVCKHLPRPADVVDQIGQLKTDRKHKNMAFENVMPKPCDPRIASAWATYIAQGLGFPLPQRLKRVPMDFPTALEICNEHASQTRYDERGQPYDYRDSLLPEHRLDGYFIDDGVRR